MYFGAEQWTIILIDVGNYCKTFCISNYWVPQKNVLWYIGTFFFNLGTGNATYEYIDTKKWKQPTKDSFSVTTTLHPKEQINVTVGGS